MTSGIPNMGSQIPFEQQIERVFQFNAQLNDLERRINGLKIDMPDLKQNAEVLKSIVVRFIPNCGSEQGKLKGKLNVVYAKLEKLADQQNEVNLDAVKNILKKNKLELELSKE